MPQNTIRDLLLFYTNKKDHLPCWLWTGSIQNNGYGKVTVNYKTRLIHRYAYEELKGSIPEGYEIDHLCRNKLCINPEHLEAVPGKVNRKRQGEAKTHCVEGHELFGDNLYVTPDGRRNCKACRRISVRLYQERKFA